MISEEPLTGLPSSQALGVLTPESLRRTGPGLEFWKRAARRMGSSDTFGAVLDTRLVPSPSPRPSPCGRGRTGGLSTDTRSRRSCFGREPLTVVKMGNQEALVTSAVKALGSRETPLVALMRLWRATLALEASKETG